MALTGEKLLQAEYVRLRFAITPEPTVTLAQILEPSYWVHVAAQLKPHSIIEVVPQDGSYYAELFVHSCDRTWARIRLLSVTVFDEQALEHQKEASKAANTPATKREPKPIPEVNKGKEHFVDWGGPQNKARVIRMKDKEVIKQGLPSIEAARDFMHKHEADTTSVVEANKEKAAEENIL